VTHAVLTGVVSMAPREGGAAVEAWPSSLPGQAFLGREGLFAARGFSYVVRLVPGRAVLRLHLPDET